MVEKIAPFEYTNTKNSSNIILDYTEFKNLKENQEITINFGKNLNEGTYRVIFELYDKYENKLTETIVNFLVIE